MVRTGWWLRPGLRLRRLGDEWLVLDVGAGKVHRVSGAAARTLGRLLGGRGDLDEEPAVALAQAGILAAAHERRDVLLGAGTAGLLIATTVLPPAAWAASIGSVSYVAASNTRVTHTDIEIGASRYRVLRIELETVDNATVTQTLRFTAPTTLDVLLVGGGGGGGRPPDQASTAGGGGGAGEVVRLDDHEAAVGTYSVRVGAAGADPGAAGAGESGASTVFASGLFDGASEDILKAEGGNGGGGGAQAAGASRLGSGGGGGSDAAVTAGGDVAQVSGRRHDGGVGATGLGGGGGGAGAAGGPAGSGAGGVGGDATDISAFLGQSAGTTRVAGGGGGGGAAFALGGIGGGSGAGNSNEATVGTNGTGGGGGGGYRDASTIRPGSRGGTGVAFLRIHLD